LADFCIALPVSFRTRDTGLLPKTGLRSEQDCQDRTARKDYRNRAAEDRTARIKQPGQDSRESTAKQLEQDSQNGTFGIGQAEQDR
jgi:hypothetical protein